MKKTITCICCPLGCVLTYEDGKITGNKCIKGVNYGLEEILSPKRVVTSTVKTTNQLKPRISVKTNGPIPKKLIFSIMEEINKILINDDVAMGQIIIENILNTSVDLIATQELSYK